MKKFLTVILTTLHNISPPNPGGICASHGGSPPLDSPGKETQNNKEFFFFQFFIFKLEKKLRPIAKYLYYFNLAVNQKEVIHQEIHKYTQVLEVKYFISKWNYSIVKWNNSILKN